MAAYKIYHKDGSVLKDSNGKEIAVHSIEYNGTWMGECFVAVTLENEAPVEFSIGDYVEYRNERFEINYDPGKIKCASKDSYGGAFKYDSVKFNALSDELARCDMLDLVLYDNKLHYTALPQFSFYIESLDDLLDRIQANLDELYGTASWKIYSRNRKRSLQRGCLGSEWDSVYGEGTSDNTIDSTSISISDQTCWDALSLVNSQFDVNFIVRNRNVYVGTAGVPTTNVFKYGKGKGLYEIEQNSESDQMIVTRLRAYGSNRNLPSRYYADLGSIPFLNITGDYHESSTENGLSVMMEDSVYVGMFTDIVYNNGSNIKHCRIRGRIDGYEFDGKLELVKQDAVKSTTRLLVEEKASSDAVKAKIDSGMVQVDFLSGANKTKFDGNRLNYVSNLPNNMACDRLMLPGFPNKTLKEWWNMQSEAKKAWLNPSGKNHIFSGEKYRPFVDSLNTGKIGVRPSSVFFDKDDKVNGIVEIYPTIEGMKVEGVRVDEIYKGSNITDDGRFGDNVKNIPNFDIYLNPKINFDVSGLMQEDFTICMKDGMCAGREFKVAGCVKQEDNSWKLTVERALDNSLNLYFPYKDFQIKVGDHFVLTGIELPDAYVDAASEKLLKYCIAYLDKNDYTRYVYQPKVDEIFMARQHDTATADTSGLTRSLYLTLKEGDIMLFKDEDLGIDAEITIDQLTIKEEDGKIPTYEVTLREEKEVGTIQKIQNQISSITGGNGGSFSGGTGDGYTTSQIRNLIYAIGSELFLSKASNDTASGIITFLKGLVSEGIISAKQGVEIGEFVTGLFGRGGKIDGDGRAELRSLTLWEWLEVPEIRFNRITVNIGLSIKSEGGGTIEKVLPDTDTDGNQLATGSCWLKLEDGEYGAIAVADLCMGMWHDLGGGNATENSDDKKGTYQVRGFKTIYFWINDVPDTDPDGLDNSDQHFFRYTLRSTLDGGNGMHPCAMMHFAQRGNTDNKERQSIVYSTTKYDLSLCNLDSWYFRDSQIYQISRCLDGFTMEQIGDDGKVYTKKFSGYGVVMGNAYIYGKIDEFERAGFRIDITRTMAGTVTTNAPDVIGIRVVNGYGADVSAKFTTYKVTRDSGDAESDAEWNAAHTSVGQELTITADDLGIAKYLQPVMFTVTASGEGMTDIATSFTERFVSTEELHIEFQPVEGKSYVVKASNVDTIIEARLYFGSEDITDSVLLRSSSVMKWTRDSGIPTEDAAWKATTEGSPNIIHIIDRVDDRHDCGSYWMEKLKVVFAFECNIVFAIGEISMGASMQLGNS